MGKSEREREVISFYSARGQQPIRFGVDDNFVYKLVLYDICTGKGNLEWGEYGFRESGRLSIQIDSLYLLMCNSADFQINTYTNKKHILHNNCDNLKLKLGNSIMAVLWSTRLLSLPL